MECTLPCRSIPDRPRRPAFWIEREEHIIEGSKVCEYGVVHPRSDRSVSTPIAKVSTYLSFRRGVNLSRENKHGQDHVEKDVSGKHCVERFESAERGTRRQRFGK